MVVNLLGEYTIASLFPNFWGRNAGVLLSPLDVNVDNGASLVVILELRTDHLLTLFQQFHALRPPPSDSFAELVVDSKLFWWLFSNVVLITILAVVSNGRRQEVVSTFRR